MSPKLSQYFEVALSLTKEAEALIRKKIGSTKKIDTKTSDIDFVTETDKEVENLIISGLQCHFPDHKFIGEESSSEGSKPVLTDSPTWIIDPIDGTMNFVHGNSAVCVSIALLMNKQPMIGIISVPMYEQLFTALKGQGAYQNGKKIKSSKVKELSKSLIYIEGGSSRDPEKMNIMKQNIANLLPLIQGYRASGSAAFNMAMIASGGADGYFEFGIHAWDMAAGWLIINEAGGIVLDPSGKQFDVMSRRLLCTSSLSVAEELIKHIIPYNTPRDDD